MSLKLSYAIALFKALASIKQMFKRIAFNLNFEYHCEKLSQLNDKPPYLSLFQQEMRLDTYQGC